MTVDFVVNVARNALLTTLLVGAPMLVLSMLVGLAISIFQATTSIQEQTLAFVPKIVAVLVSVVLFGSWMIRILIQFTVYYLENFPQFISFS
ncbi:MAG: flagellar biosynthesis protein FliQ [bacterium]